MNGNELTLLSAIREAVLQHDKMIREIIATLDATKTKIVKCSVCTRYAHGDA